MYSSKYLTLKKEKVINCFNIVTVYIFKEKRKINITFNYVMFFIRKLIRLQK